MTINILSDIHCLTYNLPYHLNFDDLKKTDVLVIAGDVSTFKYRSKTIKMIEDTWGHGNKFDHLIYCWGNHDYYSSSTKLFYAKDTPPNLPKASDNNEHLIEDVAFLCSTLWTNIRDHEDYITTMMNDYHCIDTYNIRYNNSIWDMNVSWLAERCKYHKDLGHKVVVVSHHLPSYQLINPSYKSSKINGGYCSMDKEDEFRLRSTIKPDLWIHGHSHQFMDKTIDGVRFIRNPYGYDWPHVQEWITTGFKLNTIVNI